LSPNTTEQALEGMNDEGLFEKLATAVLRAANPDYETIIHTGVNASGKTIKAPADGILIRTDVIPPRLYSFQHTTTSTNKLRSKWLNDPGDTGSASAEGDVIKTVRVFAEARKKMPGLTATLVLTTNKEPDADTLIAVAAKCNAEGLTHQVWSRSALAYFLDINPTGQHVRHRFFGTRIERLSDVLLKEISVKSLGGFVQRDDAGLRIPRSMDTGLLRVSQTTFLVARSGFGKSVACHKWLSTQIEGGGYGLMLTHEHVARSITLTQALDMALRELHPALEPDAGTVALSIISTTTPLHIVIEDVNQSGQAVLLAEKIVRWIKTPDPSTKDISLPIRLICPVWPEVWFSLDRRTVETASVNVIFGDAFSALEGRAAVQRRAEAAGRPISSVTADALTSDLGHDPLLIGLHDPSRSGASAEAIKDFIEAALQRIARHQRDHVAADYRSAARALACQMLRRRALKPRWEDLRSWPEVAEHTLTCLSHLVKDGQLLRKRSRNHVFPASRIRMGIPA
jgi:hypothetical protein